MTKILSRYAIFVSSFCRIFIVSTAFQSSPLLQGTLSWRNSRMNFPKIRNTSVLVRSSTASASASLSSVRDRVCSTDSSDFPRAEVLLRDYVPSYHSSNSAASICSSDIILSSKPTQQQDESKLGTLAVVAGVSLLLLVVLAGSAALAYSATDGGMALASIPLWLQNYVDLGAIGQKFMFFNDVAAQTICSPSASVTCFQKFHQYLVEKIFPMAYEALQKMILMEFWKRFWTFVYSEAMPYTTYVVSILSSFSYVSAITSFCQENSPSSVICKIQNFISRATNRFVKAKVQRSLQTFVKDTWQKTRLWCVGSCPTWMVDGFSWWSRIVVEIRGIVVETFAV